MAKKTEKTKIKKFEKVRLTFKQLEEKKNESNLKRVRSRIITDFKSHIAINSQITINYSNWYCGITKHPDAKERIKKHIKQKDTLGLFLIVRNAKTMENANSIEKHFSDIGTTNAAHKGGATSESIYVYMFKRYTTVLDDIIRLLS